MRLPQALLKRLDLATAITREVAKAPDRLPSRVAESTIAEHPDEYEVLLRTQLRRDIAVAPHELVWVPKARLRYRPVSAIPVDERLLYRALTIDIEENCDQSLEVPHKAEFERVVLSETALPYIARADVSSYYSYIDHSLVHERIIEEAARADTADAVVELLRGFLDRSFGIPQNVGASEVIGELVAQPVADRLARAGIPAFRRNDDFYMPAATWDEGVGLIEALYGELHALGLTLNEEKTKVLKRETLERNIGRIQSRLRELIAERTPEGTTVEEIDDYAGEAKTVEGEEDRVGAAEQTTVDTQHVADAATELLVESLAEWRGGRGGDDDPTVARSAVLSMVRVLGRLGSPAALDYGVQILRTDPGTTQQYVLGYLRRLPSSVNVAAHIEAIVDAIGPRAPAWQQAWLMDGLLDLETTPTTRLAEWMIDFSRGRHPATLRARALIVLGLHDLLEPAEILEHFDLSPTVARPDIAAAVALRIAEQADPALVPLRRAGKLYSWIVDDVIDALPDVSHL
jgi:hypothetical protein